MKRIDRPEEFVIVMKTLGVQETLRMVISCMRGRGSGRPTVDRSFSSDSEEISEIHCEDVPDPGVQSIMPD